MRPNLKSFRTIAAVFASLFIFQTNDIVAAEPVITPDNTYLFEMRDTCDLFFDLYEPDARSKVTADGKEKPTIIFMFGGGFINGSRSDETYLPWYRMMTENGYRIIAIDYRLGLKGSNKVGIAQVNAIDHAIHIAVEDLFSATRYIIENAETLGIDPDNIVISGSSAGAISVMQAEYELCNRTEYADILPENFRYAGVISFAGAILSRKGKVKYAEEPAPTMMLHGTSDKLVNYKQIRFFNLGFFGSDKLAERFAKFGYNYSIFRYLDHGHEIANAMCQSFGDQLLFLEANVLEGRKKTVDAVIEDSAIRKNTGSQSRKELYGE